MDIHLCELGSEDGGLREGDSLSPRSLRLELFWRTLTSTCIDYLVTQAGMPRFA